MGQQKRILYALEELSIPEKDRGVILEAIETLYAAGDSFSDGLFLFLEESNTEASSSELKTTLASVSKAVAVLLAAMQVSKTD